MMDTEAIYSAVCAYGAAKCGGYTFDANDHIEDVRRLLNEADEEHKALLAENERLVDEVNEARKETSEQARLNGMGAEREARLMAENAELKAKLTEKAYLLRGCYAADHRQKQRIEELIAELERIKALEPVAWIRPSGKAMLEAGGYCTVYASDGMSNHSTALYALGSKA